MQSLNDLAISYSTDKSSKHHDYCRHYETIMKHRRNDTITIVDSYGGYQYYDRGGGSLRMWRDFFPKAQIIGVDLYDKQPIDGVVLYKGDQNDPKLFSKIAKENNGIDIFIEDFSHINPKNIKTFEIVFPLMNGEGIYIAEDTESSYWDETASDGTNFGGGNHPDTTMNYLKALTDTINGDYSRGYKRTDQVKFVDMITSISFYKGFISIVKI